MQVSKLQDNVSIDGNKVKGASKYVEDFINFSNNSEEQKGNFLVLKVDEATKGQTVTFELSDPQGKGTGTLDEDGILIARLHANTQTITLKNDKTIKVLDLSELELKPSLGA